MLISHLLIIILAAIILIVLIINRIKPFSYIIINVFSIVLIAILYFGHTYLPHILQLPINTFHITHHNADFETLQRLDGTGEYPVKDQTATSFYVEGFTGKKMFYDKDKDFYVLMEGIIFTPITVKKTFHFHFTWAKAEVSINSETLKEIDRTQSYHHTFSPGFHHVKIKVYNTDVTPTKMFVSMTEYQPVVSDQNITLALQAFLQEDMNLYYTFGYKEKKVQLRSSAKPTIAFLRSSSGGAAFWKLSNCENANLKAVVYSGVGTTVDSDCSDLLILQAKEIPEVIKMPKLSECHDYAPMGFSCPNDPQKLNRLNKKIVEYTGKKLTGITPSQTYTSLTLPQIKLDDKKYKALAEISRRIQEAKVIAKKRRKNAFYSYEQSSWSKILKVHDSQVPKNRFRGFYMQSQAPERILHSNVSDKVNIKYSRKEKFHNIVPDHFLALWIGDFDFDKDTKKEIILSISWAKVKLTIDDKVIYKGGSSKTIPYLFSKGKHRIEIEYQNNYGQVDFLFDMQDAIQEVDENFKAFITPNTKVYLLGAYDGHRQDHGLDIRLKDSSDPVVLIITSYNPTHWNIKNTKNLKAVVYNSYDPGSSITTDNDHVQIFHDKQLRYTSRLMPYCYDGPVFHCESKYAFQNSINHILQLTGKKPDGFSSIELPSLSTKRLKRLDNKEDILIPQILLDEKKYNEINREMSRLEK